MIQDAQTNQGQKEDGGLFSQSQEKLSQDAWDILRSLRK